MAQMGIWFYVIAGVWGLAAIVNFITATRICYAIEARSGRPLLKNGLPGFANIIPVAFNYGVAQDEDTQALRREMNKRLLIIVGGFVAFYFFITLTEPGEIGA
ncbi:MAG: hypothetical protein KF849_12645 [Rhizobiaceae bacterium]|nr:hypothetical protein [Rhizobiaceae bacterium]